MKSERWPGEQGVVGFDGEILRGGQGFTLIELSIVLVVVGLVAGGVLVGQDLIRAAHVRATISQIESYNTAINTFYGKYQELPGDLDPTTAQQYGFAARGGTAGTGNADGILRDARQSTPTWGIGQLVGETGMFWSDLTNANGLNLNLIPGSYSAPYAVFSVRPCSTGMLTPLSLLNGYLPTARIGRGNYVIVFSLGDGNNYFGIAIPTSYNCTNLGMSMTAGMTVYEAASVDKKIDDGQPMSGRVIASIFNQWSRTPWGGGFGYVAPGDSSWQYNASGNPSNSTTCMYMPAGGDMSYSTDYGGGAALNCGLSFRFQGGD